MQRELADRLRACKTALEARDAARQELFRAKERLDELRRPPSPRKYGGGKFSVGAFLLTGYLAFQVGSVTLYPKGLGVPMLLVICLAAAILAGMLIGRLVHGRKTAEAEKVNQQLTAQYQTALREKEARFTADYQRCRERAYHAQQEAARLAQSCGLHEDYQDVQAVGRMVRYLETGRSDSLKEAINLYEQELREDARDAAAARHRREMQRQAAAICAETARGADAAEEAAHRANEAAFWGAAATAAAAQAAAEAKRAGESGEYHVV